MLGLASCVLCLASYVLCLASGIACCVLCLAYFVLHALSYRSIVFVLRALSGVLSTPRVNFLQGECSPQFDLVAPYRQVSPMYA